MPHCNWPQTVQDGPRRSAPADGARLKRVLIRTHLSLPHEMEF